MKKILALLYILFLSFYLPVVSFAQGTSIMGKPEQSSGVGAGMKIDSNIPISYPVPPNTQNLPFGQNHYYTVTMRGNGQALFAVKLVFSNKEEAQMSELKFSLPNAAQNLSVYQAYREPQCISYRGIMPLMLDSRPYPNPLPKQECEQYQEPDYSYGWGATAYYKAKYNLEGRGVKVVLPKPLKTNGNGSVVLSYLLDGVTSRDTLGAYNFSVDTIKVADDIQNLQVGIMVDPDYYLKDAKGDINYQAKGTGMMAPQARALVADSVVNNTQFDQYYNSIGQGTIVKSATNLQPNESFTVKGVYADSRWKLYGREIGIGVGIFILVLVLAFGSLFIAVKKVFNKSKKDTPTKNDVPPSSQLSMHRTNSFIMILAASFGSSLLIFLYTIGLYLLSLYFGNMFYYYTPNFFSPLFIILLGIISICIYASLLFAPTIVIGIKKGIIQASATLILTLFWLIFFGIIFGSLFFLFFQDKQNPPYPPVMPMGVDSVRSTAGAGGTVLEK